MTIILIGVVLVAFTIEITILKLVMILPTFLIVIFAVIMKIHINFVTGLHLLYIRV